MMKGVLMKVMSGVRISEMMHSLLLQEAKQPLVVSEQKTPMPAKGQVLVKIDSSPVNPSDLSFLQGTYSTDKVLPAVPGFEASGQVVASGDDYFSRRLLGKHVACFALSDGNGTWSQYMRTGSRFVVPLKPGLDVEQGAMLLVNPLSVMAMMDIARRGRHRAIANTAAAGALGRLLNRMCIEEKLPLLNIVQREEQVALLHSQGATQVLATENDDFEEQLKEICQRLHVTLAFDAVAGEVTGKVMRALPRGSEVMVYGGLSKEACQVNPGELIFRGKRVSGFWLTPWLSKQSVFRLMRQFNHVQKFLIHQHTIRIHRRVPLSDVTEELVLYQENMTAGKMIVKPWM
jgi:NADPH:quinone reductase